MVCFETCFKTNNNNFSLLCKAHAFSDATACWRRCTPSLVGNIAAAVAWQMIYDHDVICKHSF